MESTNSPQIFHFFSWVRLTIHLFLIISTTQMAFLNDHRSRLMLFFYRSRNKTIDNLHAITLNVFSRLTGILSKQISRWYLVFSASHTYKRLEIKLWENLCYTLATAATCEYFEIVNFIIYFLTVSYSYVSTLFQLSSMHENFCLYETRVCIARQTIRTCCSHDSDRFRLFT